MFIFFYKNINFCCPFCCGPDSFDIIQFKSENENNENENNGNKIALKKKEIFKKYELTEEKCKEYKESKEQLSSLGDEIFWKYFFGKLAVDLILKKAEEKGIKSKEEEIKGEKEYIDDIFYKYLKLPDEFAKIFFEEKNFDVSLDDIIFFAFLFIENIYLNDNEDVPGSLNVRKYFALKNLCTFYLKPENEIKTKYSSTERSFDPTYIIQFFNKYIEEIQKDKEKCGNILTHFNTICENKRSSLMLSFMQEKDLVETLFNCEELKDFIRINKIKGFLNFDDKFFDPGLKEKFLNRFNNDPFKTINGDFNKKFKKIIFKEVFLKDLWDLYGEEVINSILKENLKKNNTNATNLETNNTNATNLETNNTNATNLETNNTNVINKNDLDIEKKMREPTVENNGKKGKNEQNITNQNVENKGNTQQQFPRDEILKFENLNIYVGDKPEEDSFLNGFLIGLFNYRTDLVDIFKKKMNLGENNERSWEEWLSEQDNSLGNEKIDFKVGFSKLPGSEEEAFDKNLTPVDKYFCRMLLFLFKILSEKNYDTINENFSKLKDLTRQFFHVKEILKSVDGVFDVSAPDFYNTLFSFMELMYQKFLGNKGICGEKGYNIENGGGSNVDIRNIINKEQNLIRLFFGFYYIKPGKNKNFFLKHLYCGEVDNKKEEVSLDCLEKLYSEKYNVVSYCSNLIVPIQIYRENEISSNQQIKINNCEYRFKMTLNPGYYSGMINKNPKKVENNGCSFYMIDDFLYRTIYFVFSKVLNVKEKEQSIITNFINIKNVKNIFQKKYVTYFFVKRFNKEEPYDAICEKNISFDNKIQNNKDFLLNIIQEQWRTTNDQKENIKKKKKEKKKASNDNKKDIEQIWKKIKNFYSGSEDNDKNCSDPFILPTYKVEGNIFDKINDWKEFMNIIKNNGAILPEEKKDEIEINTNENNINEIEINTNENKLNENEINTNENKLNKEINMYLNNYHDKITKLEPNDPNVVYSLLKYTNSLYIKFIKIINGNIEDKKTLCSIIFDKINSGKLWKFDKFDSFIKDFNEKDFEHIDNPESNVVESFYKGWKNFIEGLPFLIQNSLLLYGVSLVIKNIENVKIVKIDKIDINPQMTFRKNLLYVKFLLSSNLLDKYNNVYDKLILKSCPNQNIEEKDSIDKSQLCNSLNNFYNRIKSLRKNFDFRKKNIMGVLKELKKYNEDGVNIAEMVKKKEFEQLGENIEVIAHVVETYLNVLKGNEEGKKNEKEKKKEGKNKNENSKVALLKKKYFVYCFNGADKAESLYLFVIQSQIKELEEDIKKINLGIKELFVGENTKDIMWKTFSLFTDSQNNNGPNKNDNNNVFKTIYEEFLKYYNKLSKMYEEKVEENNIDNDISDLDNNEGKKEKNKNKKKEEEEKEVLFRQEMIGILLDYILNFNIVKCTEKKLNEQVKNNWENNEEYFKDLLFGLHNWRDNCFLNSSIQLLLRCWDGFEKISTHKKDGAEEFFTWLEKSVENKIWGKYENSKFSEKLEISLNFIYEFFKFGKMVNDEKRKFRNKNKKITKEDAEVVYKKMGQQHKNLVDLWRLYGTNVENDGSFNTQSDSYDALRLFFNCLKSVMFLFDNKQKSILDFRFSCGTEEKSKNVEIKLSYENSIESILCDLNVQKIEDLWKKNVLKKALLDKMPLYCKLFGVFQGNVNNCTRCNVFSCNGTISCVENVHIDDFVSGQIVKNECYKCEICKKNDKIIRHEFFIPIGKYFFWGNADAATNKYGNKKSKKLESWRDRIDEFGEGNSYRNIGVGLHSGSEGEEGSGHYWAYIRSRYLNNLYFKCEDNIFPYNHPLVVYTPNSGNNERVYLFEKIENK